MAKRPQPFNNPFAQVGKDLKKQLAKEKEQAALEKAQKNAPRTPARQPNQPRGRGAPAPTEELDDHELFLNAVGGAAKVAGDGRGKIEKPLPPDNAEHLAIVDEDAAVLAELTNLVDGTAHFDIADSDEYIEGWIEGLDRRILRDLRRGDYAVQDHLDLHGLTREPAKQAVDEFIERTRNNGLRCVLIVHGRGLHSKDSIPVLKEALKSWLERGRIARSILAFATARPHDGGAGAVYVLLRRR